MKQNNENEENVEVTLDQEDKSVENTVRTKTTPFNAERVGRKIRRAMHQGRKVISDMLYPMSQRVYDESRDMHVVPDEAEEAIENWLSMVNHGLWRVPVTGPHRTDPWLHNMYLLALDNNPHWVRDIYADVKYPSFNIEDEHRFVRKEADLKFDFRDLLAIRHVDDAIANVDKILTEQPPSEVHHASYEKKYPEGINCVKMEKLNFGFCNVCYPIDADVKYLDSVIPDRDAFFGSKKGPYSHLFHNDKFWKSSFEEQYLQVLKTWAPTAVSSSEVPGAVGLFIPAQELIRKEFLHWNSTSCGIDYSKLIYGDNYNMVERARLVNLSAKRLEGQEINVPVVPSLNGIADEARRRILSKPENGIKYWKAFSKKYNVPILFGDYGTVTFRATHFQLSEAISDDRLRSTVVAEYRTNRGTVHHAFAASLEDNQRILSIMRKDLPRDTLVHETSLRIGTATIDESDVDYVLPFVSESVSYCSVCGTEHSNSITTTLDFDSNSWYKTGYPLVMNDVAVQEMCDFLFLVDWATQRIPKSVVRKEDAQVIRFDALQARYAVNRTLDDIAILIRDISVMHGNFEMSAAVRGNILGKLSRLQSNASQAGYDQWIDESVRVIFDSMDFQLSAGDRSVVRQRFSDRSAVWMNVTTRRSHSDDSGTTTESAPGEVVISSNRILQAMHEIDENKRVKYYGATYAEPDVTILNGTTHDLDLIVQAAFPDVVISDKTENIRSAAEIIEHLETELRKFLPLGFSLAIELSAVLLDSFIGNFNKKTEQPIVLMKDMIGASVWTRATIIHEKSVLPADDAAELTVIESRLNQAPEAHETLEELLPESEVARLEGRRFKILGKIKQKKSIENRDIYVEDVAVLSHAQNLRKVTRKVRTLDRITESNDVAIKGIANCVTLRCNDYTLNELVELARDEMINKLLSGVHDVRIKLMVMTQAKLLKTKFKIDHRFIQGGSAPTSVQFSDSLKEEFEN